jgi:hypothetical protein
LVDHITIADNERTIYIQPGDRFLLDLGPDAGSGWAIRADDENLIQRADNAQVIPNTQGWFEAVQVGKTDLNARSHALCIHHEGCPEVFLFFTLHVVIQPTALQ